MLCHMSINEERIQRHDYDVIVVGAGAAGVSAAIEAADNGARVLLLDRNQGGGASALSGGVVYAGGGTAQQRAAGYEDSVDNLFDYLRLEAGNAVDEATLRQFCEESPGMIPWLESHGARFEGSLAPYKTSYPTDDHYLYFSGNEKAYPYRQSADPAPRGHRTVAKGLASGKTLWTVLHQAALARGVTFLPLARAEELILEDGKVAGVRYRVLEADHPNVAKQERLSRRTGKLGNWAPDLVSGVTRRIESLWEDGAVAREARAAAVIISAGGFIYNREMVQQHAPQFMDVSPLGTPADDGSGIRLAVDAGGGVSHMDRVTAWRFLSPPSALIEGVTVGANGRRILNEDVYGATHGDAMVRRFDARGWAVYDADNWAKARKQVMAQTQIFQKLQAGYLFSVGHKKAKTLDELAKKTGIDAAGLTATVQAYNEGLESGAGDPAHKEPELCHPVRRAPFYAINISVKNAPFFPVPGLTLGGVRVQGDTGLVLHRDGGVIEGLYAAGRTAVGICSNSYISGLSLADCIFSGRRAGRHAAPRRS